MIDWLRRLPISSNHCLALQLLFCLCLGAPDAASALESVGVQSRLGSTKQDQVDLSADLSKVDRLLSEGALTKARPLVEDLLVKRPGDLQVALLGARLYRDIGLTSMAIVQYERVRRLAPEMVEPLIELSSLHLDNLSSAMAVDLAGDAVHLAPGNKAARIALVKALIASQSLKRAREQSDKLLLTFPYDATVVHLAAEVAQSFNESERAVDLLSQAIDKAPEKLSWQIELSRAYQELGRYQSARQILEKVLTKEPVNFEALTELAQLYEFDLGDYLSAMKIYRRILEFLPDDASARAGAERCLGKQADLALWLRGIIYRAFGKAVGH